MFRVRPVVKDEVVRGAQGTELLAAKL
jgi:hypothetical protein